MPKREVVLVVDDPGSYEATHVAYADEVKPQGKRTVIRWPILTPEQLACFCDENAENRNNHEFVGLHYLLARYLHTLLERRDVAYIMKGIAEYGGLDGMNGIGGTENAYADFGVSGEEWQYGSGHHHQQATTSEKKENK